MAKIILSNDKQQFYLYCLYDEKSKAQKAGGRWNPSKRAWAYAFDPTILENVLDTFNDNVELPDDIIEYIEKKEEELKQIEIIKEEARKNLPTDFKVDGLSLRECNIDNPLYNYQRHGVRYGDISEGGFLIADEMGLGKTLQALGISLLKKKNGAKQCLIICPASVKYNWLNEVYKFTNEKAIVIDGGVVDRIEKWFDTSTYYKIVNYEIFTRDLYCGGSTDNRIPDCDIILNSQFDVCIVDEIHYIKTHKSQRTKALKKFKCETKIGLTGTPIDGKLEELHSIFDFLKPGLFTSKTRFMKRHAIYNYFGAVEGYKHVEEVKEKITPYYIRRLKKNVLTDLPDKIFQDIYVEFDNKAMKEYRKLASRKHEITEEKEAIVALIRCRQYCNFPATIGIDKPSAKFNKLVETLDTVVKENKHKAIIFSQYKETTDLLVSELESKYNLLYLHGGIGALKRVDMCKDFNDETKGYEIIIMTDAGSTGINLQSASYVIMYDDNYSPAIMQQRWDRAHRIGQKNTVNVIRFICKDTIEERVRSVLDKKLEVNSQVLDEDYSEFSVGSFSNKELLKLL